MTECNEVWQSIPGFAGYDASSAGRVAVDCQRNHAHELAGIVHEKKQRRKTLLKAAAGGQRPLVGEKYFRVFHGQHQGVPGLREIGVFRNFIQDGYLQWFSGFRTERRLTADWCKDAGFRLKTQPKRDVIFPRRAGGGREGH